MLAPPDFRFLRRSFVCCVAATLVSCLGAAEKKAFDIPASTADKALKQFSTQSGAEVVYPAEIVRGVKTAAVKGELTAEEAMQQLLAGSALVAKQDPGSTAFFISRDPNESRAAPTPPGDRPNDAGNKYVRTPERIAAAADTSGDTVTLSPFEVSSAKDYGYAAASTLSGGRLSTELPRTPAAVSVLTREFLDDIGIVDVQQALAWGTNAGAFSDSDVTANSGAGDSLNGRPDTSNDTNVVKIRGFSNVTVARNYFSWFVNSDSYNTERIDISRGPNALIFGDAKSGGIVNVSTKRARFQDIASLQLRATDVGGRRVAVDLGRRITKKIAVRVNGLIDRSTSWRDFSKSDRDGIFGTLTWNPADSLQVRVDAEYGKISRHTPALYLLDQMSSWNGAYTISSRLTGTAAPASGTGATRLDTGTNRNLPFLILDLAQPGIGFVDWQGSVRSAGASAPFETRVPWTFASFAPLPIDAPAVLGQRAFRVVPNYAYSANIAAYQNDVEYTAYTATLEKRVGRNLFLEAAGALQSLERETMTPASHNRVYLDLNENLPTGVTLNGSNRNPNFLRPYVQGTGVRYGTTQLDVVEARVSAVYQLKTSFMSQRIGLLASYRRQKSETFYPWLVRVNGANPNLSAPENKLYFRTYLHDGRNRSMTDLGLGHDIAFLNNLVGRYELWNGSGPSASSNASLSSAQVFANGSWFKSERLSTLVGIRQDHVKTDSYDPTYNATNARFTGFAFASSVKGDATSPSVGAVYQITSALAAFANYSKTFFAPSGARDIVNGLLPLRRGEGRDVGLKLSLLGGRISGSIGYYIAEEQNTAVRANSTADAINEIGTLVGSAQELLSRNNSDTQDVRATGYELDITANLTPNWSLLMNASRPDSELSNSLPRYRAFVQQRRADWEAAATRLGGSTATQIRNNLAIIDADLARQADGLSIVDQVDYSANLFTRYRVTTGRLRGLEIGGGANVVGKRLVALQTDLSPVTATGWYTFSALLAYSAKWQRHPWRLQLNVSNLLDDAQFRYSALLATGVPQQYRINEPRTFAFTLSTKF